MKQVEEFEDYKIQDMSIQFKKDNTALTFGCTGTMDATANTTEVVKKCEGVVVKKKRKTEDVTINVTGHVKVPVSRKLMGLSNQGLKVGIYAYGNDSFSDDFILTARVIDMDGNVKYIAFPNVSNVKGLSLKVNNDVTEIEMNDLEFTAMIDENKKFYYEAYESELEDTTIKDKWLTNFTTELVKLAE